MKIRQTLGAAVTSLGLVVGMAGFAGATQGTISNSGNKAHNQITSNNTHTTTLSNHNNVGVFNLNAQSAGSGSAHVTGNNSAGSASTGAATNTSNTSTGVTVSNTGSTAAALNSAPMGGTDTSSIQNSGNKVNNTITTNNTSTTNVTNTNNVGVANVNLQQAQSGNASVHGNNSLGSASTGAASNSNTTTTTVNVSN
jgi:hypothetical protein